MKRNKSERGRKPKKRYGRGSRIDNEKYMKKTKNTVRHQRKEYGAGKKN